MNVVGQPPRGFCAQTTQNHQGASKSKSPAGTAELFETREWMV
jgi:hypothetical protein